MPRRFEILKGIGQLFHQTPPFSIGKVNRKVLPMPHWLSTEIVPPKRSTSRLQMGQTESGALVLPAQACVNLPERLE